MKLFLTVAASIALASAASANASTEILVNGSVPTARIGTADLDLQSDAGRLALARRIEAAAGQLCYEGNVDPVGTALLRKACYRSAVASGYGQIGNIAAGTVNGGH